VDEAAETGSVTGGRSNPTGNDDSAAEDPDVWDGSEAAASEEEAARGAEGPTAEFEQAEDEAPPVGTGTSSDAKPEVARGVAEVLAASAAACSGTSFGTPAFAAVCFP
jgi:hypothetical protein